MRPGRYGFEAPANPIEREQRTRRDAEIRSVKTELALLFALGNPWEGAQIGETLDDRGQGETLDVIGERRAVGSIRAAAVWIRLISFANEIARRKRLMASVGFAANEGAHPAAACVSHDHDVFDGQTHHPEFKCRRGAVQSIAGRVRRHEIGYVAHNKEFSRFGIEVDLRRYARIAASDQHDPGFLSGLGQMTKTVLFARETPAKEGFVNRRRAAPAAACGHARGRLFARSSQTRSLPKNCKKSRARPSAGIRRAVCDPEKALPAQPPQGRTPGTGSRRMDKDR
jgi:hypothetical protein